MGIYLAPGANAVATAGRVRRAMEEMAQRFPDDVTWEIPYDTTIFVTATIHKVVTTLLEAFVLVAIVVFVFLGRLRATLVPIVAVPVALVGTFAVMLAIGFSANTISLLALVLAIGIVVDDAIVVVEAVEHMMAEHPEMSPAAATKAAMAPDHRADRRDHLGAAVGVCAGRVHPRHRRQALPAIRRRGVGVDADLGGERADLVAGIVRVAAAPRCRRRAGSIRAMQGGIDRMQRGYAGIVGRLAPRVLVTVAVVGVAVVLILWFGRAVPSGFLPEEDQGAFLIEAQLPEGASLNRTAKSRPMSSTSPRRRRGWRRSPRSSATA